MNRILNYKNVKQKCNKTQKKQISFFLNIQLTSCVVFFCQTQIFNVIKKIQQMDEKVSEALLLALFLKAVSAFDTTHTDNSLTHLASCDHSCFN